MAGLMLSIISVIIRSKTDGNVREPGDAGMLLGIPELGVIPAGEATSRRNTQVVAVTVWDNRQENHNFVLGEGLQSPQFSLIASEQYSHPSCSPEPNNGREFSVVTSASPGEGKTTTVTAIWQ